MLTRLKVSGFKNLVDVDVRFGAFTCVAGANGVGKSNLFDAIRFLSAIADRPLIEAALAVRDQEGRTTDIRSLFHRTGSEYDAEISFVAEMIVPEEGVDDLGQIAKASIIFLRYSLTLAYRCDDLRSLGSLEILKEELVHINLGDATKHLLFEHKPIWRKSSVKGSRRVPYFISTEGTGTDRAIKLHQDGNKGKALSRLAVNLPRTVLSVANAAESPTVLMARREMQSWRLLQLEPSAMRQPDEFTAPKKLDMDGKHLPATLYYLARYHHLYNTDDFSPLRSLPAFQTLEIELEQVIREQGWYFKQGYFILTHALTPSPSPKLGRREEDSNPTNPTWEKGLGDEGFAGF